MEKLAMAALLAPQRPSLMVQPLQYLANLHRASVSAATPSVNAERCPECHPPNDSAQARRGHDVQHETGAPTRRSLKPNGWVPRSCSQNATEKSVRLLTAAADISGPASGKERLSLGT
jgi:hypothetical protein